MGGGWLMGGSWLLGGIENKTECGAKWGGKKWLGRVKRNG